MKACEIETAISRTESKGLKEKLMLDTGIIQAVKKSCFISTEVGEQSRAEVLPQPVAKVPLPNLSPTNAKQKIQINECIWWPAPHLHISSVQTENSLCRNPLTLRAINSFQDSDSSLSCNNTQGLNNTVVFPSCQALPGQPVESATPRFDVILPLAHQIRYSQALVLQVIRAPGSSPRTREAPLGSSNPSGP